MNRIIPYIPVYILLGIVCILSLFIVEKVRSMKTPSPTMLYVGVFAAWATLITTIIISVLPKISERAQGIYMTCAGSVVFLVAILFFYYYSEYHKDAKKSKDAKRASELCMAGAALSLLSAPTMIGIGIWKMRKGGHGGVSSPMDDLSARVGRVQSGIAPRPFPRTTAVPLSRDPAMTARRPSTPVLTPRHTTINW